MSALSYATIVSGPRDMSAILHKSYQMDRALGIPSIGLTSVFRSAIESLIHGELFGTARIVVITGKCADVVAKHIADKFRLTAVCADKCEDIALIRYSENLDIPCDKCIQVKLGVMQDPDLEYFYRFFDRVCAEALNEVLSGVTDQYLLYVAQVIQAPPSDSDPAVCCAQAY